MAEQQKYNPKSAPRKPVTMDMLVDLADKVTSALSVVGAAVYSSDAGAKGLSDIPFDKYPPILKRPSKQK